MATLYTLDLINILQQEVDRILSQLEEFETLGNESLNRAPQEGKWSVAQILEHLNFYNQYYLKAIEYALAKNTDLTYNPIFKGGILGNYFTNVMLPKDGVIKNKARAFKNYTPAVKLDSAKVLAEFKAGELKLKALLEDSKNTDLRKIKVPISIAKWLKLSLGDTFRFVIAHQIRHVLQAQQAVQALGLKASLS